jgi:hypothetical protein
MKQPVEIELDKFNETWDLVLERLMKKSQNQHDEKTD